MSEEAGRVADEQTPQAAAAAMPPAERAPISDGLLLSAGEEFVTDVPLDDEPDDILE